MSDEPRPRWQSISTAPLDMNEVLLWWPFQRAYPIIGARNYRNSDDNGTAIIYEDSWWCESDRFIEDSTDPGPTHWMPLPTGPLPAHEQEPKS